MNDSTVRVLVDDFLTVARIANVPLEASNIEFEILQPPHHPPVLPKGKQAVYVFRHLEKTLKVGKAGPKSGARYTSQHYSPNRAKSSLPNSLLDCHDFCSIAGINEATVGQWVKQNTQRINFLVATECGPSVLSLLEVFLQCRLKPCFEGHHSQK